MILKIKDSQLKKSLESGIKPLYYVEGNDEFVIDACISSIIKAAQISDIIRLDAVKSSDDDIEAPFSIFGFGFERRAILIQNFDAGALKEPRLSLFRSVFEGISEGLCVIIKRFVDDSRFSPSKKGEQTVSVCQEAVIINACAKQGADLSKYVMTQIKRCGATASAEIAALIAERCGDDLQTTNNEAKKLAALCNYGEITREHVESLCIRTVEAGVYDMLSCLEHGNSQRAFALLSEMLDDRTEPLIISAVLNTAFINLYRCRLAREGGMSQNSVASLFDYKFGDKKLSISYNNCMKYSLSKLEKVIVLLQLLDGELKSSAVEKRILLERRVAEIARTVEARA